MDHLEYAKENFLEATTREEYVKYATGNPYAEVEVEHSLDMMPSVQQLWERKFDTPCPEALIIAAQYHDFDRVFPKGHSDDPSIRTKKRMIGTKGTPDQVYTESEIKKVLHPRNCAAIFRDYNPLLPQALQEDASYLIERHEVGAETDDNGDLLEITDAFSNTYNLSEAAEVLLEADALSFFNIIIYSYVKGRSEERVRQKIRFCCGKLSEQGRDIAKEIPYKDIEADGRTIDIAHLVSSAITEFQD